MLAATPPMNFHLGKPILVMLIVACLSGLVVAVRPNQRKADLTVWVFADSHYKSFAPLIPKFEQKTGKTVNLNLLNMRSVNTRLGQLFMSDTASEEIPDLVEMEISMIGRFFRPPEKHVGFLPLEPYLRRSGWYDKIVETRFAPWSKDGVIFGVPHDVHPMVLTYRHDLFWGTEAADGTVDGPQIDLTKVRTWRDFHEAGVTFELYWQSRGHRSRHAIRLPEASSEYIIVMLLQRGINIVDNSGKVHLADPRVAEVVAFYAQLVGGQRRIGYPSGDKGVFTRDLNDGHLASFITPDWELTYVKRYGAGLAGRMRVMPLPVFEPGDAPTSTHGGSMIGITRACKNPDLAWQLVEYLYFSDDGLQARRQQSEILPPVKTMWADPYYHKPDPYYGGQKGHELLVQLAEQIPARHATPATGVATLALNGVLIRAVDHVNRHGPAGLEAACQQWLNDAAADLEKRMAQWQFEAGGDDGGPEQ